MPSDMRRPVPSCNRNRVVVAWGMRLLTLVLAALGAACTPVGIWLYQEPTVTVSQIALPAGGEDRRLEVVLALRNVNDFELSVVNVEIRCRVDDHEIGAIALDTTITLARNDTTPVRLPLPLSDAQARRIVDGLRPGLYRYAVQGRATLKTPIGERRVGFNESGRATLESAPSLSMLAPPR